MTSQSRKSESLPSNPTILVVGAGAVGGFYGGKLAQSGADVALVCRSDYDAVKRSGIAIRSYWGDFHYHPKSVFRHPSKCEQHPDIVLVTLKAITEVDGVELIRPVIAARTVIVILQNGIGVETPYQQAFPDNELLSALAFIGVMRTKPGHIQHLAYGRVAIGNYPHGLTESARLLGRLFEQAGVSCDLVENIVERRWRKLMWNASFNPISVLGGGVDTQAMIASAETHRLVAQVMDEVWRIAQAAGYDIPESAIQKHLEDTRNMEPYKTSMLLDYEAGRRMEVEAILGNAVRLAREFKLQTPVLECLLTLMKLVETTRPEKSPS